MLIQITKGESSEHKYTQITKMRAICQILTNIEHSRLQSSSRMSPQHSAYL